MVISPEGKELAFLATGPPNQKVGPDEPIGLPSNVEFGAGEGPGTMLYVTVDKELYRVPVKTHGVRPVWADKKAGQK
jgi:hypothetical protein